MPCHYPCRAYRLADGSVVFDTKTGYDIIQNLQVPCGECMGCKVDRARAWAIRCMHEAKLYEKNCFITLTYDEKNLPDGNDLVYDHFQKFMRALRHHTAEIVWYRDKRGRKRRKKVYKKIRFFVCGEYGETRQRPHWHACLFNYDFPDKRWLKTTGENDLYTSKTLDTLWGKGICSVGSVDYKSASYVARYIFKKQNQKAAVYEICDPETGEVFDREKELIRMSLKPGIGAGWLAKYKSEVMNNDKVVVNGTPMQPPKYYMKKIKESHPERYEEIIYERGKAAILHAEDNTDERRLVKEEVLKAKLNRETKRDTFS